MKQLFHSFGQLPIQYCILAFYGVVLFKLNTTLQLNSLILNISKVTSTHIINFERHLFLMYKNKSLKYDNVTDAKLCCIHLTFIKILKIMSKLVSKNISDKYKNNIFSVTLIVSYLQRTHAYLYHFFDSCCLK